MAKTKVPGHTNEQPAAPTEVTVTYDLLALPTAFHKAGLAGLILLIESLKARQVLTADEAKYEITPTGARLIFTEPLLQKLMDDLYDAQVVEVAVRTKWSGAKVKREELVEEEVDGKKTRTKRFIYDQLQPKGAFFDNVFDGEKEIWRKLWRDMLWTIPRGRPTTREPFNQRADFQSCKDGQRAWSELLKFKKAAEKKQSHTAELSSALFPGAQAVNAEQVPFEGMAEQNLLLHFWPLTVLLYVPQALEADGTADFVGYTLAISDVSNLTEFIRDFPKLLASRRPDRRGYRPAQAVIDLPVEGALAFMDDLAVLTGQKVEADELRFSIGGVEYLHFHKPQGENNVKMMAAGRISPNRRLLAAYHAIVHPVGTAPHYRHSLFRRGLLVALLDDEPWYRPFGRNFAAFEAGVFMRQFRGPDREPSEKRPPQFADDAARKFTEHTRRLTEQLRRYEDMPDPERPTVSRPRSEPPVIVNRVVRTYLISRAEEKSGAKLTTFTDDEEKVDWSKVPAEFNDAKRKLAESLFLEFRSRRDQAFVDHFAATFFSVTQRLAEADRLELANLLTVADRRDDLKTLTLLALSANS